MNIKKRMNLERNESVNYMQARMCDSNKLDISHKNLTDNDVHVIIDALKNNPMINVLDISFNNIGNRGILELLKSPHVGNICYLNLEHNNVGDEGSVAAVQSSRYNNIAALNLSENHLSAEGIKSLARYIPGSKLVYFAFSGENNLSAALAIMDAIRRHPPLTYIICPFMMKELIHPLLLENRRKMSQIVKSLLRLVANLKKLEKFDYPISGLDKNILTNFQECYLNKMLNRELTAEGHRIKTCNKLNNYINDNYFNITGVVQTKMEVDDKEKQSVTLPDLPAEVLRLITRHCYISDVKQDSDLYHKC